MKNSFNNISVVENEKVATIYLNKPDTGNKINGELIRELYDIFSSLNSKDEIRAIVLTGNGEYFCSGFDLNWIHNLEPSKEVYNEHLLFSKLLFMIFTHSKPVICKINGNVKGGGICFVAVSDIVIAPNKTTFQIDDLRFGIIPAITLPYLIKKIGEAYSKELILTGEQIFANRAAQIGLVNHAVPSELVEITVEEEISGILNNAPQAISLTKELFTYITNMRYDEILQHTSELISKSFIGEEMKEGILAHIGRRSPKWIKK